MEKITQLLESQNIELESLVKPCGLLLISILILGCLARFIFGLKSNLTRATSSAIGILFIYAVTVVFQSLGAEFKALVAPLPYVNITGEELRFFTFAGKDYTIICAQVLSMIILSFLVNLADRWLPKGRGFFGWLFYRILTVALGFVLHLVTVSLFTKYLPEGLVTYAPTVLLAILVLMLLTGALKLLVGALVSTVNPIIGGLYTFFFANAIGKLITRAVLTTVIMSALVYLMEYLGVAVLSIASSALVAYVPFLILLVALWYLIGHIF